MEHSDRPFELVLDGVSRLAESIHTESCDGEWLSAQVSRILGPRLFCAGSVDVTHDAAQVADEHLAALFAFFGCAGAQNR